MQNEDIIHRESGKLLNVPIQILKQQASRPREANCERMPGRVALK